jgi:gentisate 1,2-dioxygenase
VKQSGSELDECAGLLLPIDRSGDWRVLSCVNPWTRRRPHATLTLWAGQQYLGGHEDAPEHRRTPAAVLLATY